MRHRAIAGFLVFTLALLVFPCGFGATSRHAAHACCAPSFQSNSMECCNSAAPHPSVASAPAHSTQAALEDAANASLPCAQIPAPIYAIARDTQPSKRIPVTILRT